MSQRRKLASQSTVIFGTRIVGAGLVFVAQAAVARYWGPDMLGEMILVIAAVNLIAVVMPLGFETIGTYFAAEYRAKGEAVMLHGFMARAYIHIAVAFVFLLCFGPYIAQLFGEPGRVLRGFLVQSCLLALGTALVFVNSALLVGLKRPFAAFFADTLFRPCLMIVGFLVGLLATSPSDSLANMIWVLSIGWVGVALIQFVHVLITVRRIPSTAPARPDETGRWWRFALPWVLISLATDFYFDLDLLLLSGHLSREDLAIFGVCIRMLSLIAFGVSSVYAVTMPDMFESEAMSDRDGFHRKVGDANLVATGLSALLLVLVLILGPFALQFFGPDFQAGVLPLAVLCLAIVVRSALGPAALVLSIHDRPYLSLPAIGLGLLVLALTNLVLVPAWGLLGASLAAFLSITVWSLALWATAWRTAGVDVSILPRLRRIRQPIVA